MARIRKVPGVVALSSSSSFYSPSFFLVSWACYVVCSVAGSLELPLAPRFAPLLQFVRSWAWTRVGRFAYPVPRRDFLFAPPRAARCGRTEAVSEDPRGSVSTAGMKHPDPKPRRVARPERRDRTTKHPDQS